MVMKTLKSFGLGLPWRPLWGGTSKPDAPSSPSFSKNSTASFEESLSAKASTSTTSRASEGDEPSKENLLPRFKMFKHIQLFKRLGKKGRTKQKSCKRKLDEVVYCTSAKKANFTKTKADVFSSKRNSKTDSSKTTIKSTRRFDEESKKSETRSTPTDHDNALTSVTPMLRRDRDLSRDLQEMIASPRCGLQNHLAIQRAQASRNSRAFRLSQRQSLRRNLQNWVAEGPRKAATRCVSIVSRKSLGQSSDFADFRLPCRFSSLLTPDEVSKFRLDDGLMPEGNSQCSPDSPDPWNDRSSKHSFKKAGVPISLDKGPRSTLVDVHDLPDLDFFDDALPPRDKATPSAFDLDDAIELPYMHSIPEFTARHLGQALYSLNYVPSKTATRPAGHLFPM